MEDRELSWRDCLRLSILYDLETAGMDPVN